MLKTKKTELLNRSVWEIINKEKALLGISATDVFDNYSFFHNENKIFFSASIIKVPILIYGLQMCQKKKLRLNSKITFRKNEIVGGAGILKDLDPGLSLTIKDILTLMTVISDNTATNMLIDILGMNEINDFISSLLMKNTALKRKLMINPALTPVNLTTPYDSTLILKKLFNNEILDKKHTLIAIDILSRQQYKEKIPLFLKNVKIANKTGEISNVANDTAIIYAKTPFILTVLSKKSPDIAKTNLSIGLIAKKFFDFYNK